MQGLPGGNFIPYDAEDPVKDGLTKAEIERFHLSKPRPISYENGVMMTAGQHKGAMLLTILHDAAADVDAVVYNDDNTLHVANVYAAMLDRATRKSPPFITRTRSRLRKSSNTAARKTSTARWNKLSRVLEEVLQ